MKKFLVGGAVRNHLLGIPAADRDWVVLDASVEDMLTAGFKQVGKDFPVFLHPETEEEYALARAERVGGKTVFGENVSLEEDLSRRDFTVNAMAMGEDGQVVDPFGGRVDVKDRTLRMVSETTLRDDPVRVFRAARLAASLGFSICEKTKDEMSRVSRSGVFASIPGERVCAELKKGLSLDSSSPMWSILEDVGALGALGLAEKVRDFSLFDGSVLGIQEKFGLLSLVYGKDLSVWMDTVLKTPSQSIVSGKTLLRLSEVSCPVSAEEWLNFMNKGDARRNKDFTSYVDELRRLDFDVPSSQKTQDALEVFSLKPERKVSSKAEFEDFLLSGLRDILTRKAKSRKCM